jgi:outer membrane protein assembly factor BamB
MRLPACVLLSSLCLVIAVPARAQWSQFRGPNGSGVDVDTAAGYPSEFSPTKNVAWKAAVPYGQSSPVIAGTRLYLTASEGERLITICFDKRTGRELWRRDVKRDRPSDAFKANDPASPTPAADDDGIVAFFPDFGLVAYTPDGAPRWTARLGPFKNFYGMAGSPIIAGGLVVLVCDQQPGAFVTAFDRSTGRVRWKTDRSGIRIGWATPIVFHSTPDRADLIVLGSTRLDAYDLATGAPRWWVPIGSGDGLGTPLILGDSILASALGSATPDMPVFASVLAQYDADKDGRLSQPEFRVDKDMGEHFGWIDAILAHQDGFIVADEWNAARQQYVGEYGAVAIRPGAATGKLDAAAIRWRFQKNIPYIPAPLLYQDVFYMVKTGGIVTSLDPATGKLLKEGRATGAIGEFLASPVAADGKVFLSNSEGKIAVLKAGAQWSVIGVNDLGEDVHATPALSDGRIYVRTHGALYCFAAIKSRP